MLNQFELPEFEIRDIEVELSVTNAGLMDAFLINRDGSEAYFYEASNGEDLSNYTISDIGKGVKVVVGYIPEPQGEAYFEQSEDRFIAEIGTSMDYTGRIRVDGSNDGFQIKAQVVGFKLWQNVTISYDCVLNNQERGLPEWLPCEEEMSEDSDGASDTSIINAYDSTFEDLNFDSPEMHKMFVSNSINYKFA